MSEENCTAEDKTPGIFSWRELVTQNLEGSTKFYTDLFGWTTTTMEMPGGINYTMFMAGERPVAGMIKPPAEQGNLPTAWLNYITVESLDTSIAKALELGASLCMPATEIPGRGSFAVITDPQGAAIAFWQFAK